jgi:LuxR family maltose regulon positive regulatory protein
MSVVADRPTRRRTLAASGSPEPVFPTLDSKLTPPPRRPGTVPRSGLVNRLRVARSPVVLVTGAPGYGKTTLVAEWARRDDAPFAWYTIDESDDPVTFVAYLGAAVAALDPDGLPGWSPAWPAVPRDEAVSRIGAALAALADPVVLVLDDVHLLRDAESARLLGLLVAQLPARSRLVLIGRSEPRLPLARLRAQGRLVEIGPDDLRLGSREASALLRGLRIEASRREVDELNRRLEGWPAGLHLAARSLRGRPDGAAADALVSEYFRRELLSRLDAGTIVFLTRTSVLDRLCGPLCETVSGTEGAADVLERLERRNVFVESLDREHRWYRVHPAFRDVLRGELERREPGLARTLLGRAADWCAASGDVESAVEYALEAGDGERVTGLIGASVLPFSPEARSARVERWLDALDDERLLRRRPDVAVVGALTHAMAGRPRAASRWAGIAARARAGRSPSETPAAPGPWKALLRSILGAAGPAQKRADAERALRMLPLGSRWRAPALVALAEARLLEGDRQAADATLALAAEDASASGVPAVAALALACRSLLASPDARQAGELAEAAQAVVREARLEEHVTSAFAFAAGARVALGLGDSKGARESVARAERLVPGLTEALAGPAVWVRLELARVHLALGDPARALRLLDEADEILAHGPPLSTLRDEAVALRARLEKGRRGGAGRSAALTSAELRLLPLLRTHLSFREIAERLYVSRNTVKTQAISVYRKLGVSSRGEAIERASDLGLVADPRDSRER